MYVNCIFAILEKSGKQTIKNKRNHLCKAVPFAFGDIDTFAFLCYNESIKIPCGEFGGIES